jgi:methionyl-tRNA formyltransferase
MNRRPWIVLACGDGDSTRAIAHALEKRFGQITIVMEQGVSKWQMARRRAKKLGFVTTAGQVAFILMVTPILRRSSRKRIAEIERKYELDKTFEGEVIQVDSINSPAAIAVIKAAMPDVVVVSGTRIISKKVLDSVNAPFINMHAGITPLYRGVHGAYWALLEKKPDLVGTTVHLVDAGIDTGNIIDQSCFTVDDSDNFATYPYLHTAAGIPALLGAVEKAVDGRLEPRSEDKGLGSQLRYHPTIWQYLYGRFFKGVR